MGQLALGPLPWEFWIATCAYRCCCSADAAAAAAAAPPVANIVERRSSSRAGAAAVAPMPMPSSKSLKSARSTRHANGSPAFGSGSGSPTASSAARRVRFGDTTVLGEDHAAPEKDDGSSVHSNESEAPLAYNMQSSG